MTHGNCVQYCVLHIAGCIAPEKHLDSERTTKLNLLRHGLASDMAGMWLCGRAACGMALQTCSVEAKRVKCDGNAQESFCATLKGRYVAATPASLTWPHAGNHN